MEKYIRTKDGRILSLNEFKYEKEYHWYRPNEKYLSRLNIDFTCWKWCFDDEYDSIPEVLGKITVEKIKREECKFADEIEDLCDRFVLVDKDDEGPIEQELIGKRYRAMLDELRFRISTGCDPRKLDFYGAIWTDKGLIYVAKMNEKGEFELL